MTTGFDSQRETHSALDVIPINVSAADYDISDDNGVSDDIKYFRGIMVGTAGAVAIVTLTGRTRIIPANCLAVGQVHPIAGKAVLNAGTGASEICVVL